MRVALVHPDLGIGGAERLVVDAATSLQDLGHEVVIYTSHYEASRSFPETRRLEVRVRGDFLPRHVCGRGHVLWASVRNAYAATCLALSGLGADVVLADQVSTCVPILRLLTRSKVLFYVHFPDKLLASRNSWLRRLYRWPFDLLEEATTSCAHRLVVNSRFTASVVRAEFPLLVARTTPIVLYPSVPVSDDDDLDASPSLVLVSLNRYERKKRVDLAVRALELLPSNVSLVVAGGYDPRLAENVDHYRELLALAADLGLADRVAFERSVSDDRRETLLAGALCLLYTPPDEHFGIVPLEAMALGCPVVAANSGGPLETVKHQTTGFLVEPAPDAFAAAVAVLIDDKPKAAAMRRAARLHVRANFSRQVFAAKLDRICTDLYLQRPCRDKSA